MVLHSPVLFLFAVHISLQNATIFVNFPFLLPLLEFFTTPPSDLYHPRQPQVTTASQTFLDAPPAAGDPEAAREERDVPIHKTESRDVTAAETFSQVDAAASPTQATQMKIFVHGVVKDPDIVLLSDATNRESEALIVQVTRFR